MDLTVRDARAVQVCECLFDFPKPVLLCAGIKFLLPLAIKIDQIFVHLLQRTIQLLALWWTKRPVTAKVEHLGFHILDMHQLFVISVLPAVIGSATVFQLLRKLNKFRFQLITHQRARKGSLGPYSGCTKGKSRHCA
ncbi:hypothetical protein GCM10007094_02410 [Pseudovibrio japonicus]|uniref:Uncharacterized protein n=1 Tax=Pseudovibrio japonicus TaxID=366534 RepID=A0ABQ3DXE9_9HYPH|nr:hypothetical protein GCM10007094_02410 [Pseudovibrio japonicus]